MPNNGRLMTGYPDLDAITGGFRDSDVIVLAARPSQGKSALALNIAMNVALEREPVLFFSLEMSAERIAARVLANRSKCEACFLGQTDDPEVWLRISTALAELENSPLFITERAPLTIHHVKGITRRMARLHPLALVVIDYVELMNPSRGHKNENAELTEISQSLRELVCELGVPILLVSQATRQKALEADADVVIFLHRQPSLAHDQGVSHEEVKILVGKNRNGPTGRLGLIFRKEYVRFESIKREAQDG